MTSVNLFTPSGTAPSQATLDANTDSASQTEGQALYQQASQSPQPEAVVKRQFEQRNRDQKTQLANEFIEFAGREGINHLATTPEGQHALAVVYAHAEREGRDLMRQVHEEQGNTAVDYSGKQNSDPDDPLSVGDSGVKIGPRINGFQYTAMTAGVIYGLAKHVVTDLIEIGKAVGKESQRLKDVDSLEFLDIDKTEQKSDSPGLTMPSWQDIGTGLKRNIQETNQAITTAKEQGEYFIAGKAISNDPVLQMTGLGDLAVFGTLAKMRNVAKLDSLATENPEKLGIELTPEVAGDGKLSTTGGNSADETGVGGGADAVSGALVRLEVIAPNGNRTVISSAIEEKILFGQRVIGGNGIPTNRVRGGHSPEINDSNANYAVEVLQYNSDETQVIKFYTQFPDGKLSKIKKSTVFPTHWDNVEILNATRQIGNTNPLVIRIHDRSSLHRGIVNGVEIEVIKMGDDVTSAYPTGGITTPLDKF